MSPVEKPAAQQTDTEKTAPERALAAAHSAPCHLDLAAADAAARLLNGAGRMTAVCHDGVHGCTLDTALHGAAADGTRYMVAAPQEGQWPHMPVERPQRVSLTITSEAPLAEMRMTVCELTGPAVLTRCSEDEEAALLAEGPQPSSIARDFPRWPGAQLWRVEPLRMTIHHPRGSHMLDREALAPRPAWPSPMEELETIDVLRSEWGPHLSSILPELRAASSPTAAPIDPPGGARCATGRAYPVSITDRDLTVLLVDGPRRETAVVPLPRPVSSPDEFAEGLRQVTRRGAAPRRG